MDFTPKIGAIKQEKNQWAKAWVNARVAGIEGMGWLLLVIMDHSPVSC